MMPSAKTTKANSPGDRAQRLGGLAEVWISVMPCACSVAAAVTMMDSAIRLE